MNHILGEMPIGCKHFVAQRVFARIERWQFDNDLPRLTALLDCYRLLNVAFADKENLREGQFDAGVEG